MKIKFSIFVLLTVLLTVPYFSLFAGASELPKKYVTEAETPVLNQKNNPLCWAYACADMLSINAIKNGYAENGKTVFSAPMIARAEFDGNEHRYGGGNVWYKCSGGIDYALMAATSGKGLSYNSDYPTIEDADKAPVSALYSNDAYVDRVNIIDVSEMTRKQRTDTIKRLIKEYGAVNTDVFVGDYNKVTGIANILSYDNTKISHAVLLVGWDDTKYTDTGTGAYLMKNSWGENWGNSGYAWISYNSEFGRHVIAANVVIDSRAAVLSHTETPYLSGTNADASSGEFGAVNVFKISEKTKVFKAGVFTNKPVSEIEIRLYKNPASVDNISKTEPSAFAKGRTDVEGYYVFEFDNIVDFDINDTAAVLYLIKSEKCYYLYSEYSNPDFELAVTNCNPGQSYVYDRGELREAKRNFIGTLITKTERKEPVSQETEAVETAAETTYAYNTETDAADITDTGYSETESETDLVYVSLPEQTDAEQTAAEIEMSAEQISEESDDNKISVKSVIKTVFIIAAVVIVLFIVLVFALIAASKKKKV